MRVIGRGVHILRVRPGGKQCQRKNCDDDDQPCQRSWPAGRIRFHFSFSDLKQGSSLTSTYEYVRSRHLKVPMPVPNAVVIESNCSLSDTLTTSAGAYARYCG